MSLDIALPHIHQEPDGEALLSSDCQAVVLVSTGPLLRVITGYSLINGARVLFLLFLYFACLICLLCKLHEIYDEIYILNNHFSIKLFNSGF